MRGIFGLFTTSCGFGGVFAEDQQGVHQDQLLTLLNERGVGWSELPEGWEVTNIARTAYLAQWCAVRRLR